MSLDLFEQDQRDQLSFANRASAAQLPATFAETFGQAWNENFLVRQSVSGDNRKSVASGDYADEMYRRSGDEQLRYSILAGRDQFNARIAELKKERPDLDIAPLDDDEVQRRADDLGRQTLADVRSFRARETTIGGDIGSVMGDITGAIADPVNIAAAPLAVPGSLGIIGTALAWGGIAGGSQTVIEALNAPEMDRIQPGYSDSAEPAMNILTATGFGAALGGGVKGAAAGWSRVKHGEWPRTVRDAGNVVESEAQTQATNPFPGIDGEVAHRAATQKAVDDLLADRPVDVDAIIPPEVAAAAKYDEAIDGGRPARISYEPAVMIDGQVYRGVVHVDALERAALALNTTSDELIARHGGEAAAFEKLDGFVDEDGKFVTRAEAYARVEAEPKQGQLDLPLKDRTAATTEPPPALKRDTPIEDYQLAAAREQVTPEAMIAARTDDDVAATVLNDLDKLRAFGGNREFSNLSDDEVIGNLRKWIEGMGANADVRKLPEAVRRFGEPLPKQEIFYRGEWPDRPAFGEEKGTISVSDRKGGNSFSIIRNDLELEKMPQDGFGLPQLPVSEIIVPKNTKVLDASKFAGANAGELERVLPPGKFVRQGERKERFKFGAEQDAEYVITTYRFEPSPQTSDLVMPVGETVGADGKVVPIMRNVDDVMGEIDARLTAAKEIEACAFPQAEAAE